MPLCAAYVFLFLLSLSICRFFLLLPVRAQQSFTDLSRQVAKFFAEKSYTELILSFLSQFLSRLLDEA